jgi:hypothetical protein
MDCDDINKMWDDLERQLQKVYFEVTPLDNTGFLKHEFNIFYKEVNNSGCYYLSMPIENYN